MLDLVLAVRIILIAITSVLVFGALISDKKNKGDWQVIAYLIIILIYIILR